MAKTRNFFDLKNPLAAITLTFLVGGVITCAAHAEPLVEMDGKKAKPAVVTEWEGDGKKVTLSVKDGTDAQAVADAIKENVSKVRVKVKGGKIIVSGKSKDELLKLLAEVDFGDDDLGALADAALDDEDEGSGSSLRAKKTANLEKKFKNKDKLVVGKVVSIKYGKQFPDTIVIVKVTSAPKGALGKKIKRGKKIAFKPMLKKKGKGVKWSDESTQTNAGAWFLQKKDKVRILVGKPMKGGFEASAIDRF